MDSSLVYNSDWSFGSSGSICFAGLCRKTILPHIFYYKNTGFRDSTETKARKQEK